MSEDPLCDYFTGIPEHKSKNLNQLSNCRVLCNCALIAFGQFLKATLARTVKQFF
jgi:muramoyltetrapeptide carboxypeptidase LdcA involved in peptidoglycan recycling